jgi:parallel beta-helix repeat protein
MFLRTSSDRNMKGNQKFQAVNSAVLILLATSLTLSAANLCVNSGGTGGCASSITSAISIASPGDVIRVSKGTYHEDVVIDKSLSVLGESSENTIVDATGLLNGINVDGYNNPGMAHVIVSGFRVQNANAQGILVTNATDVTVSNNHVTGNDKSLDVANLQCPPLPPYFQGGEGFDCGEGIHLSGVDHSIVSDNLVDHNAGGILLSDDTAPTFDNVISGNIVRDNPFDCGITLASHHFHIGLEIPPYVGVHHNTIIGNTSTKNGLSTGEGAGVGIFAGPPGAQNTGNVVVNNVLTDNALPGVAIHSHAGFQQVGDHIIVGNAISGNGADSDPGTTVPTGISISNTPAGPSMNGIVISQNVIKNEGIGIGVNTPGSIDVHFNSFLTPVGIDNLGAAIINATANWWKCSHGPGANGCATVSGSNVTVDPWLTRPFNGN